MAISTLAKSSISTFDKFNKSSAGNKSGQRFFATGPSQNVFTSLDGITWTANSTNLPNVAMIAPHRNGDLVCVYDTSYNRWTSADNGTTWLKNGQVAGFVFGASFVYQNGSRYNNVDKTWNLYPNNNFYEGNAGSLFDVTNAYSIGDTAVNGNGWGGSGYATNGSTFLFSGGISYSPSTAPYLVKSTTRKGGQLSTVSYGASVYTHNCDFGNGLFAVTAGNGTGIYTSPDTNTWTSRGTNAQGIIYLNNLWFAWASNSMWTSSDGTSWTSRTPTGLSSNAIRGFAYGAGVYVLVAQAGYIATSTDGITWTQRTSGTGGNFNGVIYG